MHQTEKNKRALLELLEAVDAGRLDEAMQYYSPDYVDHDASEGRSQGANHYEGIRHAFRMFWETFDDVRHWTENMTAEEDRVAVRLIAEGRHTGEILGIPPTNKVIQSDSLVIYRFADGKIIERWCRERTPTRALLEAAAREDQP